MSRFMDSRLECGLWGCHWLSCQIVLSAIGFVHMTALFMVKKMVSGTCRPHDLLALGLEEESLVKEFWLPLLWVTCPLLSLCCVGIQVMLISETRQRQDIMIDSSQTWWGGWQLLLIGKNSQYPPWMSYPKWQSDWIPPLLFWSLSRRMGRFLHNQKVIGYISLRESFWIKKIKKKEPWRIHLSKCYWNHIEIEDLKNIFHLVVIRGLWTLCHLSFGTFSAVFP